MTRVAAQLAADALEQDLEPAVRIHLDANGNAPPTAGVIAAVIEAMQHGGNPSSAHAAGEDGRVLLTSARDAVASLLEGALPENVTFTSGCTEANNTVVAAARQAAATLIITAVEHPSVLRAAQASTRRGGVVEVVPVCGDGRVDPAMIQARLRDLRGPVWISVQAANSETGVLQPVAEIAALSIMRDDVLLHSDAAQAFGKVKLAVGGANGPDVLSLSGHKLHAPMGVGALVTREGEDRLSPLLFGGDQEAGMRAGTQSLPLIAGFGAACHARRVAFEAETARMRHLRDRLEAGIRSVLPSVRVNGEGAPRLPNTSNLLFPGVEGMALVGLLDAEGVLASLGSACHSRRPEPSGVLTAMGLSEADAWSSVRFSVSPMNTEAEIDAAVSVIASACRRLGIRA